MVAHAETVVVPRPHDGLAARILRAVAKAPVQILLAVIGLLWLVPTFGLFITSIVPQSAISTAGWWRVFAHPSLATFSNYSALFHDAGLTNAMKTTAMLITRANFDQSGATTLRNGRMPNFGKQTTSHGISAASTAVL